jgi:DNA-binding response OmpR family regulator
LRDQRRGAIVCGSREGCTPGWSQRAAGPSLAHCELGARVVGVPAPLIAVIDDDEMTRLVLIEALTDEGYAVIDWDGHEAPEAFVARARPALIILDLRLGSSSSPWPLINALAPASGASAAPLLVCTADATFVGEHRASLAARSCGILLKPFDLDMLFTEVRQCLEPSQRALH